MYNFLIEAQIIFKREGKYEFSEISRPVYVFSAVVHFLPQDEHEFDESDSMMIETVRIWNDSI